MNKFFGFISREWFTIILLVALCYAIWGNHGDRQVDSYVKGGVGIALVAESDNALAIALENAHWIHNGRGDICYQLIISFDDKGGMYFVYRGPAKDKLLLYTADPEEVFDYLQSMENLKCNGVRA